MYKKYNNGKIALNKEVRSTSNKQIILRKSLIYFGIVIFLLAIIGVISYQPAKRAMASAEQGKDSFLAAQEAVELQDFSLATRELENALNSFKTAKNNLQVLSWARLVPLIGRQYSAASHLLNAGISTGEAIIEVTRFGMTTIEPFRQDGKLNLSSLTASDKKEILKKLYEAENILLTADDKIDEALEEMEKVPKSGLLKPLHSAIEPISEKLPLVKNVVHQVASISKTIPLLAGYPEAKTYLFILENNTELRPTGGFIGTFGVLQVDSGEIISFITDNIYNIDVPAENFLDVEPPDPLKKYLKSERWFLRDSNWSPDFPTSAEKALWFYQQERGPVEYFDGVIAVTPTFIESLIELTGEITIQNIVFSKDNFIDTLQYQVEQGFYRQGIPDSERKEIIGELSQILLDRVLSLPQSEWDDLWTVFLKDIEQKQILMYLRDESLQNKITEENWGGQVFDTVGDYIFVVDANMASLKSDPGVKRTIDYQVFEENNSYHGKLKVTYQNEGTITWKSTRYRTYTRIYLPLGSELISASGYLTNDKLQGGKPTQPITSTDLQKTVVEGFIAIEPQETSFLEIEYLLPKTIQDLIKNKQYLLDVQKQPGAAAYNITFSFFAPYKPKIILPLDNYEKTDDTTVHFTGILEKDIRFSITD